VSTFASPEDLPAPAGYSHVVTISPGPLVWTSGQIAVAPDGSVPEGWEAQTRLVFAHLGRALQAGGATWRDVVKLTFWLVDLAGLPAVRAVRDEHIDATAPPTSSLVQVAGLVRPELLLEVEAVAAPR
jgi:enamine deaminase RidA (YjgF/YER057c/UK114 family)